MNPYACNECDWQYDVWTMEDRVKAAKRHQLTHLLERWGWLNSVEDVVNTLIMAEQTSSDGRPADLREALVH